MSPAINQSKEPFNKNNQQTSNLTSRANSLKLHNAADKAYLQLQTCVCCWTKGLHIKNIKKRDHFETSHHHTTGKPIRTQWKHWHTVMCEDNALYSTARTDTETHHQKTRALWAVIVVSVTQADRQLVLNAKPTMMTISWWFIQVSTKSEHHMQYSMQEAWRLTTTSGPPAKA